MASDNHSRISKPGKINLRAGSISKVFMLLDQNVPDLYLYGQESDPDPANIIQIPQATDLYGNDMDPYQGQDPDSDPY